MEKLAAKPDQEVLRRRLIFNVNRADCLAKWTNGTVSVWFDCTLRKINKFLYLLQISQSSCLPSLSTQTLKLKLTGSVCWIQNRAAKKLVWKTRSLFLHLKISSAISLTNLQTIQGLHDLSHGPVQLQQGVPEGSSVRLIIEGLTWGQNSSPDSWLSSYLRTGDGEGGGNQDTGSIVSRTPPNSEHIPLHSTVLNWYDHLDELDGLPGVGEREAGEVHRLLDDLVVPGDQSNVFIHPGPGPSQYLERLRSSPVEDIDMFL